jgi:hypothetical protein
MSVFAWLRKPSSIRSRRRDELQIRPTTPRFRPQLEPLESRWLPSTLTVLNTADNGPGSLRAEIAAAQSGDTIVFDPSLAGQTINLTSGELVINTSLNIEGLGGKNHEVAINDATSRIFDITNPSANVTIANLGFFGQGVEVTQGGAIFDGGATLSLVNDGIGGNAVSLTSTAAQGGAIYQAGGTLNLTDCQLGLEGDASSFGAALGGVIYNAGGVLNITGSAFGAPSGGIEMFGGVTAAGGYIYDAAGSTVTITKSTFQGSQLFTDNGGNALGGAVYQAGGSLTVSASSFGFNSLDSGGVAAGGAVCIAGGNVSMVNSSVVGNLVYNVNGSSPACGGGVYLAAGNLSMTNCAVSENFAVGKPANGGAAYQAAGNLTLTNCAFSGNGATDGGAVYQAGGALVATRCTFSNDTAFFSGAGLIEGGALSIDGAATMQNCAFDNNSASAGIGGAIFVAADGTLTLSASTVTGNSADTAGGGIYNTGTLYVTNSSTVTGNTAPAGADLYNLGTFFISSDSTVGAIGP